MFHGVISLGPLVFMSIPSWKLIYISFIFPSWLILSPSLWLYVEGLTSQAKWKLQISHLLHLVPFIFGVIIATLILILPTDLSGSIFFEDSDIDSGLGLVLVICIFSSMILWILQTSFYLYKIVTRLIIYRQTLKNIFASNEKRELTWLSLVLVILCTSWLFSLMSLISTLVSDNPLFDYHFGSIISLVLVWSLAYWGLRQKPGFEGDYTDEMPAEPIEAINNEAGNNAVSKKYERSALQQEQAERIANKIVESMNADKHYLDSNLTLPKLANNIGISANYISQTLNETMNTNFFDYVNARRIEYAKPKILANEESVLNIALESGFNARSSFYKAFKKQTGTTPTKYRQLKPQ